MAPVADCFDTVIADQRPGVSVVTPSAAFVDVGAAGLATPAPPVGFRLEARR
jgi:hypothetical protein